ncbi:DUF3883 domain-containing protein [Geodermatophilus sp. SYSU D00703]
MRQPQDDDGQLLVATFEVEARDRCLDLILHSAGGAGRAGGVARNRDYPRALEVLLGRLRTLDAVLTDAVVDSTVVASLPPEERRLPLQGRAYPVTLRSEPDMDALRRTITRAQGPIGRSPAAKPTSKGNERKRIRLGLRIPGFVAAQRDAHRLELALATLSAADQDGARRHRGQGAMPDAAVRIAVEQLAMRRATQHYKSQGWEVEDVSANRSYDLHCRRDGDVRHVEVKGTTTAGDHVLLTPNEVALAVASPSNAALYVVSGIQLISKPGQPVSASGAFPCCSTRGRWTPTGCLRPVTAIPWTDDCRGPPGHRRRTGSPT